MTDLLDSFPREVAPECRLDFDNQDNLVGVGVAVSLQVPACFDVIVVDHIFASAASDTVSHI